MNRLKLRKACSFPASGRAMPKNTAPRSPPQAATFSNGTQGVTVPPAAAASAHVAGTAGSGHPTLRPLNCSSETVRKPPALQRVPDAERLGCCPHRTRQTHPHTTQHESLTLGIRGLETHLRRSWPTSAVQHGSCRERRVWHKSGNSGITRHQIATPDHVTPVPHCSPHCSPRCCRLCVMGRAWFQTCPRLWKVT